MKGLIDRGFPILLCLTTVVSQSTAASEGKEAGTAASCSVGSERVIEILCPKEGFVGAPPSPHSYPTTARPMRDEDFSKRFVRVRVAAKRAVQKDTRIVLRLDEVDEKGQVVRNGLYFAYIDLLLTGSRMIPKRVDDSQEAPDSYVSYGLPFPLEHALAPTLALPNQEMSQSRMVDGEDGVVVTRSDDRGSDPQLCRLEVTTFRLVNPAMSPEPKNVVHYDSQAHRLHSTPRANTKAAVVMSRQSQVWKREGDWLWQEMEKRDGKGNVLMRCKQIDGAVGEQEVGRTVPRDTSTIRVPQTQPSQATGQPPSQLRSGENGSRECQWPLLVAVGIAGIGLGFLVGRLSRAKRPSRA